MTEDSFDWLDRPFTEGHSTKFGQVREDLRRAEEVFSPDMPHGLLLRLYDFIERRIDNNDVWEVLEAQTTDLLLSRMIGGPVNTLNKHSKGFDPEDFVKLNAAVRADELTNMDMLNYYTGAQANGDRYRDTAENRAIIAGWKPLIPLIRQRIMWRLNAHLHVDGGTNPPGSTDHEYAD